MWRLRQYRPDVKTHSANSIFICSAKPNSYQNVIDYCTTGVIPPLTRTFQDPPVPFDSPTNVIAIVSSARVPASEGADSRNYNDFYNNPNPNYHLNNPVIRYTP